ncbi:hypothetical protein [Paenibacillus sp. N3.4]|uniref:RCC1 domain-containing protein n=1 Tax=Paenibacillus sp. N3.4 TaxID=2603222 RepID=UPI0011C7CBB7|nr:hypothetical protein [Paenibacillus sp. N3.4]TXK85909.1 hypothetical protein FU659_00080 [Paenibacillus sp. N3.4]
MKDITVVEDQVIALQEDGTVWSSKGFELTTMKFTEDWKLQINERTSYNITTKQVPGFSDIVELGKGTNNLHLVALKNDGTVMAWGNNQLGQLTGKKEDAVPAEAVQVPGLTDIIALTSGLSYNLALKKDGTIWKWGYMPYLYDIDEYTELTEPTQVKGIDHVISISAGFGIHTAIRQDGTLWAWGQNLWGQLGDDTNNSKLSPVQISFPKPTWMLELQKK